MKRLTILISILSTSQSVIAEDCSRDNQVITLPDFNSTCCEDTEWLIRDQEGQLRCQENPCYKERGVLFKGGCHDILEDAVCGEEALGERLFIREDGVAYCDCDEGWVRFDGRCYQQFTPAFCQGKNEILQLNTKPSTTGGGFINQEELIILKEGFKKNFSCVENPCEPSFFPHRPSWIEDEVSDSPGCYQAETDLTGCEVVLGPDDLLECCSPANRTICINGPKLVLFSPTPIKFKTCRPGMIYSKPVDKCVTAFKL